MTLVCFPKKTCSLSRSEPRSENHTPTISIQPRIRANGCSSARWFNLHASRNWDGHNNLHPLAQLPIPKSTSPNQQTSVTSVSLCRALARIMYLNPIQPITTSEPRLDWSGSSVNSLNHACIFLLGARWIAYQSANT